VKAGVKGGGTQEHELEAHWGATVARPHKKGEPGSDLPFKIKGAMNKCMVGFFFSRVVIPDHFPLPDLNVCTEEREQARGWEREWGDGRRRGFA